MHYVIDEKGNRVEGLSKEEILAVMQQAIDNKSLEGIEADSAFVSKLKCCVGGDTVQMAFITQAKYNELFNNDQLNLNTLYFITDDTTEEILESNIDLLATEMDATNETLGDFDERLNNLGFKEGTIEFDSSLTIDDGDIVENYLHRQGNYVLGELKTNIITPSSSSTPGYIYDGMIIGQIPNEFLPKSQEKYPAFFGVLNSNFIENYITIDVDGSVKFGGNNVIMQYIPSLSVRIGYEAKPIG